MTKITFLIGDNMIGFLVAMFILIGTLVVFSIIYKKETGRNFFKDIFNDMCGR